MRLGLITGVLVLCCVVAESALRPKECKPGGQKCNKIQKCKIGYQCIRGYCCKAPACKPGWSSVGQCLHIAGQKRCPGDRDQCINDVCCRPRKITPPKRCPKGFEQVPGSCQISSKGKGYLQQCPMGSTCHNGLCCQRTVKPAKCPQVKPPKVCPKGQDQCKTSRDCHKGDICCKGPCYKFCYKPGTRMG